jgi:L-asparaginase / beta-aspartyl-peptidase
MSIIPVVLAKTAIDFLNGNRDPDEAAQMAIETGCIVLDREGRIGWAHNSSDMACAYMTTAQDKPVAFTKKTEA